jgi:hypothetical protein
MKRSCIQLLTGLAAVLGVAAVPASVYAACGDLNNDGAFNASDCLVLAQCLAGGGTCPAVAPGPLCGSGSLAACGDMFGDGNVTLAGLAADLAVCLDTANNIPTLYDKCTGPGPSIMPSCTTPDTNPPGAFKVVLNTQTITSSQTWPKTCNVYLNGLVQVKPLMPGAPTPVIKIEKGSVVRGIKGTVDPNALVFQQGAHIDAQGTPLEPIVFTSDQPPGSRDKGDWSGVEFNGRSTVNRPGCTASTEGIPFPFGGCINNDTSGIATFVRAEFCGRIFSANNELNVWTMNAVGSGTQFNFIQAQNGKDDCFEWFGGTVNHKHLVASGCADDAIDTQLGYTGSLQYALYLQNGLLTDVGRDSRGIESDNSEFNPDDLPRDNPINCNLTLLGANKQAGANDGSDSGVLIRRGGDYQLGNSIVQAFNDSGVELRDLTTTTEACSNPTTLTGRVALYRNVVYDNGSSTTPDAATEQPKDNDGTLDTTAGCDTGACALAGCPCDSELWWSLLQAAPYSNVNPCGSNAVKTGISENFPALDNTGCTGPQTPLLCCSGAGTGTCRALMDARPVPVGTFPTPFNCKTLSPVLDDNTTANYIGAINPAAACTTTGAGAACDWITKPWVEFAFQ